MTATAEQLRGVAGRFEGQQEAGGRDRAGMPCRSLKFKAIFFACWQRNADTQSMI